MDENYVREGADITASDMVQEFQDESELIEFYKDSTILLTGSTGFIGKMILEKLLRTCNTLKRIYILLRPKKGKEISKRFEEIFNVPCFDYLKRNHPNFEEKISIIYADLTLPNLGLADEDEKKLIQEVNCILHCAATVRFDEPLRNATYINVRAVKDLIGIAKKMKDLKAFVTVSTAFSNCIRHTIDEVFYEPPMDAEKLLQLVDCLEDDKLNIITPHLLGDFPNAYVFTKAIAESVVEKEGKNLPIAVFRPSIVLASVKEPIAGWIDNLYGATGVLMGAAVGLLRTLQGIKENRADMVPADYVVNGILAAAWDVASVKTLNDNQEVQEKEEKFEKEIPIYNFVSSPEQPITWDLFEKLSKRHAMAVPSELCVWYYYLSFRKSKWAQSLSVLLLHMLPAYIVDFLAICIGKKPRLVKGYQKINKFCDVLSYFTMNQWNFSNKNIQTLWKRLTKTDQNLFEFSMKELNWDTYFYTYVRGARVYLLKDPLDTIPKGEKKYFKLKIAHYVLLTILYTIGFYVLYKFTFGLYKLIA